jgi:hypothetical protein
VAELCERVGKDKEEEGRHDETKSERLRRGLSAEGAGRGGESTNRSIGR